MYTIALQFDRYRLNSGKPVLRDYTWWVALVRNISHQADNFQIRCWPDEPETIAAGQRFGTQSENAISSELVFQGPITEDFIEHICNEGFNEDGGLKWFTIFFSEGEQCLFSSEHYGTEPYIFLKTEEEVHQLVEWSKQFSVITRVDQY